MAEDTELVEVVATPVAMKVMEVVTVVAPEEVAMVVEAVGTEVVAAVATNDRPALSLHTLEINRR